MIIPGSLDTGGISLRSISFEVINDNGVVTFIASRYLLAHNFSFPAIIFFRCYKTKNIIIYSTIFAINNS